MARRRGSRRRPHDEFVNEWLQFLEKTQRVCQRKLEKFGGAYRTELEPLLGDVVKRLTSPEARADIQSALRRRPEKDDEIIESLLTRELRFFNRLVDQLISGPGEATGGGSLSPGGGGSEDGGNSTAGDDEAAGAAKTIKESVEKWLGNRTRRRLKKLLEILNELLSLIKGG